MRTFGPPTAVRRLRVGHRTIPVTAAFDSYWKFAHARQEVFFRRVALESPPWTSDEIIANHRFTNVYRASDRVSQYLIRNVLYRGDQRPEEIFFRAMVFKLFNRISTWEHLTKTVGDISWENYNFKAYNAALDRLFVSREKVYSAAYIMPAPAFNELRKHANHLRLVEHMMRDEAPRKIADASSLERVFQLLLGYPSLGDFLAFQLTIDLNYSELIDFSEMEFVVAGPGARDGIRKCFLETAGLTDQELIRLVADIAEDEFDRLDLHFRSLWGRRLQLIDCQNIFCELSKYARVAHPEIAGLSGRTRIKQKYAPSSALVPQWYPVKWGINDAIENAYVAPTTKTSRPAPQQQSLL
jgi:hypothetical protein